MLELIHTDDIVTVTQKPPGVQASLVNPREGSVIAALYFTCENGNICAYMLGEHNIGALKEGPNLRVIQYTRLLQDACTQTNHMHALHQKRMKDCAAVPNIIKIDEFSVDNSTPFAESLDDLCTQGDHFSQVFADAAKRLAARIAQPHEQIQQAKLDYIKMATAIRMAEKEPTGTGANHARL
jgi:hypothetical protein